MGKSSYNGITSIFREVVNSNSAIFFIHGFKGNPKNTFAYIPEIICNSSEMDGWNVYGIGYSTSILPDLLKGIWTAPPDISKLGDYIHSLISTIYNRYDRIVLVGHSMGGLVIQDAILKLSEIDLEKISNVLLFGTPSNGLKKAGLISFINSQFNDMSFGSQFILKLRNKWNNQFNDNYPFNFKVIAGTKDEFVPVDTSLNCFNEVNQLIIEGNHSTIVKSKDILDFQCQCYQIIINSINNTGVFPLASDEERNILLGNYHFIINKYLSSANELSSQNLVLLIFALENSGREQEAKNILTNHPKINTDSDLMGVLGGRYKRNYLLNGLQADYDKAYNYYSTALKNSMDKSDKSQIYYHAINLAFLSIQNNDRSSCQNFAEIALDNCIESSINLWEIAVMAEGYLYKEDFDKSIKFYIKAAAMAGNSIREKDSMYLNAFYGYQALTGCQNSNSEYIVKLRTIFS